MTKAFWILAALDAIALLVLLVLGLNEKGHNDGGREMGLLFFVMLPLLVLTAACVAFHFVPLAIVRWLLLALVAAPACFYAFVGVSQLGLRTINDPANGFANPAMRETVRAVGKLDVESVRKWAPQMDKDIDQSRADAPLRLAIESMLKEIKTRLPAQVERHLAIVKILLDNGAKPNEALEIACWTRSGELLQLMFQAGADPNFVNQYGGNAFSSCLGGGMVVASPVPALKAFIDAGAKLDGAAAFAVSSGEFEGALYVLERGGDAKDERLIEEVKSKLTDPSHSKTLDEIVKRLGLAPSTLP